MTMKSSAEKERHLSRRNLLAGGALLIAIGRSPPVLAVTLDDRPNANRVNDGVEFAPNGFLRIDRDGRIVLVIPSVEMGQGIYTAEAMLIAEELEVGLDQITVAAAPADERYAQPRFKAQLTGGSTSIRGFWEPLREAGAQARMMLIEAASRAWNVPIAECSARRARVIHTATGRTLAYAELAEEAGKLPSPSAFALKPISSFSLIGKSVRRVDTPDKVNGSAVFGLDVDVPGMKTAAVSICPTIGGKLKSLNDAKARARAGVIDVLQIADAVAVVADHYWAARSALDDLEIEWDAGPNQSMSSSTILDAMKLASATGEPIAGVESGDLQIAFSRASKVVEAVYELPFLAHATLEPINTTVHVRPDGCDIWVGTQVPAAAQKLTARVTGLPRDRVTVHNHLIGGGFGRRLAADTIEQAVYFAKQVSYPLKVVWTREQDIRHDHFRPAYYDRLRVGLGSNGLPIAWTHRVTSGTVRQFFDEGGWPQGKLDPDAVEGARDVPYKMGAIKVDWVRQDPPLALNWWRGVGPTHNVFVVESFIDELASAAGRDPLDYRRALLTENARSLAVLDLAASKANWDQPLPARSGRGISLHDSFDTRAAMVVEVAVDEDGNIELKRVVVAIDCGVQINPDSIRAQIEGGALFGLSAALYNQITFANGQVQQGNFNDYRQLRINEAPQIEVHLVRSEISPGGMGEVGTVSAAPALTNAIYAATGVRLRKLPIDRSLLAARKTG